ncbi:MAG: C25 family cysteine peptidase [Candidatus Eisenbacteria bacterium]|nr:C25 family cysteine peptidase [Candidatus Eisenbacteria bacterium]
MSKLGPSRSICIFVALLIVVLACGAAFGASQTEFRVLSSEPDHVVIEMELGDLQQIPIDADGRACLLPVLEDAPALMEAGAPELPVLRQSILIGDRANVALRVLDATYEELPLDAPIVPSKGHLTRNVNPAAVPFQFGATYAKNAYFPAQEAVMYDPFVVRDFRGVVVEIRPVRYNPVLQKLEVARRMTIELAPIPGPAKNPLARSRGLTSIDPEFTSIYGNLFLNWREGGGLRYTPIPEPGRCLILTADSYYNQILPLYQWELQKGIPTILKRLSEVGSTGSQVKAYIQSLYDEPQTLTYVILVGDSGSMPYLTGTAEGAPSDPMYVMLSGNDHYPDAMISRISAQNATHVETQVSRSIRYEKTPDIGTAGDWYHLATGIASNAYGGGAYDWQRANWLRDVLLGYNYTQVDQIYDPTATKQQIFNAINEGRSLVNYIGHGSTTAWSTTGFNVNDVYALTNGFKNPYICSVACSNGDFTYGECFAEAWLRAGTAAAPKGAIGIYAASTLASWVPPCDMQTEVVRLLCDEERNTLGGLSFNGACKGLDLWPGYEGIKLVEQYNLFGDCTVMMRTTNPAALAVVHEPLLLYGQATFPVQVTGVAGARVALYANNVLYGSAYTDGSGLATIPVDPLPAVGTSLTLTVTAYNAQTYLGTVNVTSPSNAMVHVEEVGLTGGVAIAGVLNDLTMQLHNTGTDPAHGVTAKLRSMGGASIYDSTATFGDIAPDQMVWGLDGFSFKPDRNAADGSDLPLKVKITSTEFQTWWDTVLVRISAPNLAYRDAIIDDSTGDWDGRADAGEAIAATLSLTNYGSATANGINASLMSLDPMIHVTNGFAQLATLEPGQSAYLTAPYRFEIAPEFAGSELNFSLRLALSTGRVQILNISLPAGGFLETVDHGTPRCSHEAPEGFADEWHVSDDGNVTPGGSHVWKCGGDSTGYAPLEDARLMLPPLNLGAGARLAFWHCMDAEADSVDPAIAYDGGVLEISHNGGEFVPLVPDSGYTHVIHERGGPFAEQTACFSGHFDWTRTEVDLSEFPGLVQIRFRFGSDSLGTGAGWMIDDIEVRGVDATVAAPEFAVGLQTLHLAPAQPNPFNPRTLLSFLLPEPGTARLQVVDASGRIVRTLLEERCEAGERSVVWDGRDDGGRPLPSGVYWARLEQSGRSSSSRLVMLK